jgi:hypothetical protein
MSTNLGHRRKIIEIKNTKPRRTLDQVMQQIASRQHIINRTVTRLMRQPQTRRKSRKFAIINFGTYKSSR